MLAKKVQSEFAFLLFLTFSRLMVTEIVTDSFEGNILLMQFQIIVGLFLFLNNKPFDMSA